MFGNPLTGEPLQSQQGAQALPSGVPSRWRARRAHNHDLRHTFGTHVAASGDVSLRTLQEWMGHKDSKTTLIYADYLPDPREAAIVSDAFGD